MATEHTKDDAKDEEKVDDLPSDEADSARLVDFLVAQTGASHTHSESKLDVVDNHDDECHNDGPKVLVSSHLISALVGEATCNTRITLHIDVVSAAKHHKVDDED